MLNTAWVIKGNKIEQVYKDADLKILTTNISRVKKKLLICKKPIGKSNE